MIRVYGFEGTPHLLPQVVPGRISYLEIVRQLEKYDAKNLKGHNKQSIIPNTLCFGDFTVVANEGYEKIDAKLAQYNLPLGNKREKFDAKGFIHKERLSQGLLEYEHVFSDEDVIRNHVEASTTERITEYNRVMLTEEWKRRNVPSY